MKKKNINKPITILFSALVLLLIIIVLNIVIHIYRTNEYNKVERTLSNGTVSGEASLSLSKSGAWDKEDAVVGDAVTNGETFTFTFENDKKYSVRDWTLRIDIPKECYLNQAWNGTVEIHQNVLSGSEKVDTLDLHNFDFNYEDVKLEYKGEGSGALMIHLYEGDYIIYHPSTLKSAHELPLEGEGESVSLGLILYYNTSLDITSYSVNYYYGKSITQGVEWVLFCVLSTIWVILLSVAIAWVIIRHNDQKELDMREAMLQETIGLITSFVDAKDTYTKGHSSRVAEYTVMLADKLNLNKEEKRYIYYIAILHDIGKCYVPDDILKKPGKLTMEEFNTIKSHTTHGAEMLKSISSMPSIANGAHYHHERYDGKGYPEGLKGEEIPYIARIICVADSFDAMTSSRCYRNALTKEKVLSELENGKGTQFDPKVADAMIELVSEGKIKIENWEE